MNNSGQDDFFETDGEEAALQQQQQLMAMLDTYDKPLTREIKPGMGVDGVVSRIGADFVFVDIGERGEAVMKVGEVSDEQDALTVSVGDPIKAYVASARGGEIVLTRSLSGAAGSREQLYEARKNGIPVHGKVTGVGTAGLQVKVMGKAAFCPISQVEIKYVEDVNVYLGKSLTFVITRIAEGGRSIILSRIPLLEKELETALDNLAAGIEQHTVHTGTITRIADFGLFVELGGVEGLVHISEVSWMRSDNLDDSYAVGREIQCVVLNVEKKSPLRNSKVSLSIKRVGEDPWNDASARFAPGTRVEGVITRCAPFGAFVGLAPGIEGLIHVSEMSWNRRVRHPEDVVKPGDRVAVTVLAVDGEKRTVSCSLKDVQNDPWNTIEQEFKAGMAVRGVVASRSKFGYFIDIREGITGLLPFAGIGENRSREIKEGEELDVTIERIDALRRRISLSYGVPPATDALPEGWDEDPEPPVKSTAAPAVTEFGAALHSALKKKKH